MKNHFIRFVAFMLTLLGLAANAATAQREVLPTNVTPLHYQLNLVPNASKLSFDGYVEIAIQVNTETNSVMLNAADLVFKKVSLKTGEIPSIAFDTKNETATLQFSKPLLKGKHLLQIDYSGKIFKNATGLFALDYASKNGTKRALYTQFENSDARRMLPCWDEPGIKATFQLAATVPGKQMVISNTPVFPTQKPAKKGLKTVLFGKTPKMSTYLLFFALGDFERITNMVNGVELGVVVKRGDTAKAQFALDAATKLLPYFEDYFGVKYPLPKLDMLAGPGSSQFFGAMENWGAIFYFESRLLVDPAIATESYRRSIFAVVAHEMAHQWFGNLVTMEWWDNLWLNEGFASWMQNNAAEQFYPEWNIWLSANRKEDAMAMDAKAGTHPIIQPIVNVFQASQAFDDITYRKGSAVIRMLESYAGPDTFRAGVRAYMKKYAYGNTVSDDLWREVDAVSPKKITQIAHDFTLQAGIPLIDVKSSKRKWRLEQSRFAVDDSTPIDRSWQVPVEAQLVGAATTPWKGIVSRDTPATISDSDGVGILVNPTQSGYYRTRYDEGAFKLLATNFRSLQGNAQLGLLNDEHALGYAGYVPLSHFLSLAAQSSTDLDPIVLTRIVGGLSSIDGFYDDLKGQSKFRDFGLSLIQPIFASLGWTAKAEEDPNTARLRANVIATLAQFGDEAIIRQANQYFSEFLKNPRALPAELRATVLGVVAESANEQRWQDILQLAQNAPSFVEQQQYYAMLPANTNLNLANKTLALAFDPKTPHTLRVSLISGVAGNFAALALDFVLANHAWLMETLNVSSRSSFVPRLAGSSYDRALITRLDDYAKQYLPKGATQELEKVKASIRLNADIREKRIPEIDAWLKANP